jgi:fructose/tagatose bisphosphate aldolase
MSPAAVVVHDLGEAKAALKAARGAGRPVVLLSAPGAAQVLGPAVWREMIAEAARAEPGAAFDAILDCGQDLGAALAALRAGVKSIALDAPAEVFAKVSDIAKQLDATVYAHRPDHG